jgi:hypothetical protein
VNFRQTLRSRRNQIRKTDLTGEVAIMSNVHIIKPDEETRARQQYSCPVERVYYEWDRALSQNDMKSLADLYADDAVLESPLIPHLLGKTQGVCRGKQEILQLLDVVARRKPSVRQYHRTGYLTDGKRLIWEYPRAAPNGDQMDFVEAMEVNDDGLIRRHCVYWGWYGVGVLQRNEYH